MPISPGDIEISHQLKSQNKPIIVKFLSHKVKSSLYKKRTALKDITDKDCQFYFIQEIYSVPDDANTWSNERGGDIFFSHGSTHSRGVCILINPSCSYTVESLNRDQNGRIISINLSSGSANISLCNIYAPNDLQQQLALCAI